LDVNIPRQTVHATASLSRVGFSTTGVVFCGITNYWVQPVVGGPKVMKPAPMDEVGVAPGMFDSNVVTVAFVYGVANGSGDCRFNIFGFG
jgi:hypothetical protein